METFEDPVWNWIDEFSDGDARIIYRYGSCLRFGPKGLQEFLCRSISGFDRAMNGGGLPSGVGGLAGKEEAPPNRFRKGSSSRDAGPDREVRVGAPKGGHLTPPLHRGSDNGNISDRSC